MAFLTVAETAELLSVSERTVRRWIAAGKLDVLRVAGTVRVRGESLEPDEPAAPPGKLPFLRPAERSALRDP